MVLERSKEGSSRINELADQAGRQLSDFTIDFLKGKDDKSLNAELRDIIGEYYESSRESELSSNQYNTLRGDIMERINVVKQRIREGLGDLRENEIDLIGYQKNLERLKLRKPKED